MSVRVLVLSLLAASVTVAQRPAPISADQAGPGPGAAVPPSPPVVSSPSAPAPAAPAATSSSSASSEQQQQPGCSLGTFHAVGESWFTNGRDGCLKYTCQRSGVVSSLPCPRVLAPEGCSVHDGDADALYPGCCPRRECAADAVVPLPAVVEPAAAPASTSATPSSSSSSSTEQASTSTTTAAP